MPRASEGRCAPAHERPSLRTGHRAARGGACRRSRDDAQMKVLVISAEYPPIRGGISTFARNLVTGLGLSGHTVAVATCVGATGSRAEDGASVPRAGRPLSGATLK